MVGNGIKVGLTPLFPEPKRAVESIATPPPYQGHNLRSTSRSNPHSSRPVATDQRFRPRPKGTNRKEGEGGVQGEDDHEEVGRHDEPHKVEANDEEANNKAANDEDADNKEENDEDDNNNEGNVDDENDVEGEGIGGDDGVTGQHGPDQEAGRILRTAWDPFCHCGSLILLQHFRSNTVLTLRYMV